MWTEEKIEILVKLYPETDNTIISETLKIKRGTLIKKANDLGVKKSKDYISKMRKKNNPQTYWSNDEVNKLIELYKSHSNNELSILLNKTTKNVGKKLSRLELKRSKIDKDFITGKACKKNGRDLTFELVNEIAKRYNTRHEFYLKDRGGYSKAIKMGWLDSICGHMIVGGFSIPQLILKDVLEFILGEKCKYDDRTVIKPLEIDCYFPKWKIGWEYDGRYYHNHSDDKNKKDLCLRVGVKLFNVHEFTNNYRDYNHNIKTQIINQLDDIKLITGINITKEDILNYSPKIVYPNLLTLDEMDIVKGKKMSEIKLYPDLFKRIKKYKLFNNDKLDIINDLPRHKIFKNFEEYKQYLIERNYSDFIELCKYEHPHRLMKKWGLPITLIHNLLI
jgi:hypothetical protein